MSTHNEKLAVHCDCLEDEVERLRELDERRVKELEWQDGELKRLRAALKETEQDRAYWSNKSAEKDNVIERLGEGMGHCAGCDGHDDMEEE